MDAVTFDTHAIRERFAGPVRIFLENRYVFRPFWEHHNDWGKAVQASPWRSSFRVLHP